MRRDTLARLAADAFALAASLLTATLTAHALGPAGKGYYATLTLLAGLLVVAFEVGIGDAMIVLVGLGRAKLQDAARATMQATLYLAVAGTLVFVVIAILVFRPVESAERPAVAMGGLLVAVGVCYSTLVSFLLAAQRVALVAAVAAIGSGATAGVMVLLAVAFELHVEGAIFASLCGAGLALGITLLRLRTGGIPVRPRRVPGYLPEAFRMGFGFLVPSLLIVAAARLDLLLVFELSGSAAAGRYSVALTIGALAVSIPTAIAYAAFPRISSMGDSEARSFTARVFFNGMLGAIVSALLLAAVTPFALPWMFGEDFRPAVTPTLILLAAAVPWSGQWLLARSTSARGDPMMLMASFTIGFLVMIGLDFVLIPAHGESGGAVAALVSSVVGLGVAVAFHHWRRAAPSRSSA